MEEQPVVVVGCSERMYVTFVDRRGSFNWRYYIPLAGNEEAVQQLELMLDVLTLSFEPVSCWLDLTALPQSVVDERTYDRRRLHMKMDGFLSRDFTVDRVDDLRRGKFYFFMLPHKTLGLY
jgi:hypothetical protein